MIFANAGVFAVAQLGVFGPRVGGIGTFIISATTEGEIAGIPLDWIVGGTIVLAFIMLAATAKIAASNATTAQGITYVAFAGIFWVSFGSAFAIIATIPIAAINIIIIPIFFGINILVFIMALLQMASGGTKTYD